MTSHIRKIALLAALAFACGVAKAQEPASATAQDDPELRGLEWNRYVAGSFTIVSLDNSLGAKLAESIESIKQSSLRRWGFPDVKISKECRIFCVPKQSLLVKLFNLQAPKMQARKELYAIWTVLDSDLEKSVGKLVAQVALSELELKEGVALPTWFERGAAKLASTPGEIRDGLRDFHATARKEQFVFTAEQVFSMTDDEYAKQSAENKKVFDMQSECLCLMLRKEFGEAKLQGFLRLQNRNKPESVLRVLYGYPSFSAFEKKYYDFMKDLTSDIVDNSTPDSYLTITAVKR